MHFNTLLKNIYKQSCSRNTMDLPIITLGVVLLVCSLIDLKTREVPDWVSHLLIFFGISVGITSSVISMTWQPFISMVGGLVAGLIIALFMFYAGQWGGGDSKLIIGVGTIVGFWVGNYALLTFIANLFLIGAVYGLVWSAGLAIKHRKEFWPAFLKFIRQPKMVTLRVFVLLIILLTFVFTLFFWESRLKLVLLGVIAAVYVFFYLLIFVKVLEKSVMTRRIDIKKLTEGDWIAEEVVVGKKKICGPKDLGVTLEQLKLLQKLRRQNKIKTVLMKSGIPFVPSFFFAYLAYLAYGDWVVSLIVLL